MRSSPGSPFTAARLMLICAHYKRAQSEIAPGQLRELTQYS
jgi:hypothetical protein